MMTLMGLVGSKGLGKCTRKVETMNKVRKGEMWPCPSCFLVSLTTFNKNQKISIKVSCVKRAQQRLIYYFVVLFKSVWTDYTHKWKYKKVVMQVLSDSIVAGEFHMRVSHAVLSTGT